MNGRIFICGGHLTPALAVIEEIKRQKKPWEIIFVGRKTALEGEKITSEEFRLITAAGIRFLPLNAGRVLRSLTLKGVLSILKFPLGLIQALGYVAVFRPKLIVAFGGYVGLPVSLAGWLMGVPVIIHEQTPEFGFANKLISKFSKKILVSTPELLNKLPPDKGVYTGLPVRSGLFSPPQKPTFDYDERLPLIYITGGATGAASLNELIFPLIPILAQRFMTIHQTGELSLAKAQKLASSLAETVRQHYRLAAYFETADVAWIYKKAILVIGRSGANTTSELALLGKAAILIPLRGLSPY